jgi:hypothetical protein
VARPSGRYFADRWLVLGTGLAAALPVIVSTARGLSADWAPEADQAITATRAHDVLTSQTPLVGAWSTTSNLVGDPTFSPGPLLYWLLAVPVRLPGLAALPLTMAAVSLASVLGVVALAFRRGGRPLMFVTAAAVAIMCASLQTEVPREIWPPSAAVMTFTLLIFLCWSVACGDYRFLPLVALTASFAMQCHLAYVVPSLGLVAVGLAGLAVSRGDSGPLRRWALAGLVVAVVCWSAPLIDQGLSWAGSDRGYGNLGRLAEAARSRGQPVGEKGGAYAVVRAIGVAPWWLRAPQPLANRAFDLFRRPAIGTLVSAMVVLGGLVALFVIAARRRRWDVAAACAVALVLCGGLGAVTAAFPNTGGTVFSYGYASWWASPAGMFVWLAVGWSALRLLVPRRALDSIRDSAPAAAVGLAGVVCAAVVVSASQGPDSQQHLYKPAGTVIDRLDDALPDPGRVRVAGSSLEFEGSAVFALRRRGATVGVDFGEQLGTDYVPVGRSYDQVVDVREGKALPPGARLVAAVEVTQPPRRTFTVSLRPVR